MSSVVSAEFSNRARMSTLSMKYLYCAQLSPSISIVEASMRDSGVRITASASDMLPFSTVIPAAKSSSANPDRS